MEDDHDLDRGRADRSVWLMKCPVVVAKAWEKQTPSISSSSSESPSVAKVVLGIDLLQPDPSPEVLGFFDFDSLSFFGVLCVLVWKP